MARRALATANNCSCAWTHYRTLMSLEPERRVFYEQLAATGRWSSRELERQINSMLYERTGLSGRPEELAASLPQSGRAPVSYDDAFRDPYLLDFVGLSGAFAERDLEKALVVKGDLFLTH